MTHPPGAGSALPARSWLGLLGGGQLGRMFTQAAQAMGYRVCVLDPAATGPTAALADRHIQAAYDSEPALAELAALCPAVTTEFENVPASSLDFLAARVRVSPEGSAVAVAQDRIAEKAFVRGCGVDTAPTIEVRRARDLEVARADLFPAILKAARLGYDGKGQTRVASRAEAASAFIGLGEVACVLEKRVDLACEVSVLIARDRGGRMVVWPPARNVHREGILHTSTVPCGLDSALTDRAISQSTTIAERLNYVGVLCIEFFVLRDGSLYVNEMAPRPHNSGHWTLNASVTSQFEQQVRILAGLPLGDTRALAPAVMLNLLGDLWFSSPDGSAVREPDWEAVLRECPSAKLHLYGKAEARRGRKMGHLTMIGHDLESAVSDCARAAALLGLVP